MATGSLWKHKRASFLEAGITVLLRAYNHEVHNKIQHEVLSMKSCSTCRRPMPICQPEEPQPKAAPTWKRRNRDTLNTWMSLFLAKQPRITVSISAKVPGDQAPGLASQDEDQILDLEAEFILHKQTPGALRALANWLSCNIRSPYIKFGGV